MVAKSCESEARVSECEMVFATIHGIAGTGDAGEGRDPRIDNLMNESQSPVQLAIQREFWSVKQ